MAPADETTGAGQPAPAEQPDGIERVLGWADKALAVASWFLPGVALLRDATEAVEYAEKGEPVFRDLLEDLHIISKSGAPPTQEHVDKVAAAFQAVGIEQPSTRPPPQGRGGMSHPG